MTMLDEYRKDRNFKLDSLSYYEMFNFLKEGIIKTICKFEKVSSIKDICLDDEGCSTEFALGIDKSVYPRINLKVFAYFETFSSNYNVVFNPFEIEMDCVGCGTDKIYALNAKVLKNMLTEMMLNKFPHSNYKSMYVRYFKMGNKFEEKNKVEFN